MLRDERFRAKNDELERCVQSRKRKLSQLYFATVHGLGTKVSLQSDEYRRQEAAFLDANDITKGRFFDQSTLPLRPVLTPVHAQILPARSVQETPKQHGLDTRKENRTNSLVGNATPARDGLGIVQDKPPTAKRPVIPRPQVDMSTAQIIVAPTLHSVGAAQSPGGTHALPSSLTGPSVTSNVSVPPQQSYPTPLSAQKQSQFLLPDSSPKVDYAPQARTDAPPTTKRDSVSIAPHHDVVPSSPISTGPSSVHTSATDRSPASTSTEESAYVEAVVSSKGQEETQETANDQNLPDRVPATPDQQLKFETEMSDVPTSKMRIDTSREQPFGTTTPGVTVPNGVVDQTSSNNLVLTPSDTPITQGAVTDLIEAMPSPALESSRKSASASSASSATPRPERMTTRVSSGAIRHKSVSEILGETPRSPVSPTDKSPSDKLARDRNAPPRTPVSVTENQLQLREKRSRKGRSKLSTVVFPKPATPEKLKSLSLLSQIDKPSPNEQDDYLYLLFLVKAYFPPRGSHLTSLLATAHKTLTTTNHMTDYAEQTSTRTLKRLYQLQHSNRWPLRQLQRSPEPARSASHWDVFLDHMKWMRMDFREERKWKLAAAKNCAEWCAEYVISTKEDRVALRISARPPVRLDPEPKMLSPVTDHSMPDLIPSADDDSVSDGFNDDFQPDLDFGPVPATVFSLPSEEFTFRMEKTIASEKLLEELPLYTPARISPDTNKLTLDVPADSEWKKPIAPVSKWIDGKIHFAEKGPPRKKSRYDYDTLDDESDGETEEIPPEQVDVALFKPENKMIRDRVHPSHCFRPPTEHPMPTVSFYESRMSSQWTITEDDELRKLVREYSYNWSLISSCMASPSIFVSGAERRTPWECFERWIGLEGLPADMAKTPYFRAYSARLDAAQRSVLAQQQAAQQQQQQQLQQQNGNSNPPPALIRRRTTQPVRVERKRASRHLTLLAGIRKLTQKREAVLQKQQHGAHLASLRKTNETNQPRPPISTPAEFSKLKYDREVKYHEKQEQYRQQMLAHQRAAMAQRLAQQQQQQQQQQQNPGPQQMLTNVIRPASAIPTNGAGQTIPTTGANGLPNGMAANGGLTQPRPHSAMQAMPNGTAGSPALPNGAIPMKMMPQVGIQQAVSARPGIPMPANPDNARIMREANRVQEQQRLVQSRQQQHQFHNQQPFVPQVAHSSPTLNIQGVNPAPNNAAMMSTFQAVTNVSSPSFHPPALAQGMSNASPRMNHPNALANNQGIPNLNSIQSTIQRTHPNLTPEQAGKLAHERLQQYHQQQQRISQAALNAAAGNIGSMPAGFPSISHDTNGVQQQPLPQSNGVPNGGPPLQLPQTQGHSPLMRVQQLGQPGRLGVTSSPAMNGMVLQQSRSATPQNRAGAQSGPPMQGASVQAQGPKNSPRPPQAQMATG